MVYPGMGDIAWYTPPGYGRYSPVYTTRVYERYTTLGIYTTWVYERYTTLVYMPPYIPWVHPLHTQYSSVPYTCSVLAAVPDDNTLGSRRE